MEEFPDEHAQGFSTDSQLLIGGIADFDTDFGIVSYRNARQAAAGQFNDHAGHKLYWTAGFTEGLALYDELTSRGLKHGRDYHMITYGSHQAMGEIIEEELPYFELNNLKRAGLLCELILSQLENAVPRQIPIPTPFYPGGLPLGKPV